MSEALADTQCLFRVRSNARRLALISPSIDTGRPIYSLSREAQLPRALNALGLLEHDFPAHELLEFVFGGSPEMFARCPGNSFSFNHHPLPRKASTLEEQETGRQIAGYFTNRAAAGLVRGCAPRIGRPSKA